MKYIKNPIPIEAIQWNGNNFNEINNFMDDIHPIINSQNELIISTLEGDMRAPIGSYIIKGVDGEYYPCRKNIFETSYTPLRDESKTLICKNCHFNFSIKYPKIYYDALRKKYLYWTLCPACNTKIEWEN